MPNVKERETIIRFTERREEAQIYTHNRRMINKLEKMGFEGEESDGETGLTFEIPKNHVRVQAPGGGREWTSEQREEVRERLAKARGLLDGKAAKTKAKSKVKAVAKPVAKSSNLKAKARDEDDEDEEEDEDELEETEVIQRKPKKR